jgi:hypothetical protein
MMETADSPMATFAWRQRSRYGVVLLIAAGLAGSPRRASADECSWTRVTNLPLAVLGAAAASDGTYVYLMAGHANGVGATPLVYRYNPRTNSWNLRSSIPTAVVGATAVYSSVNHKIYVFG